MKYALLVVLVGCGGQAFQVDSQRAPDGAPDGGASGRDAGGTEEATTGCDASPTQACKRGTPCCDAALDAAAPEGAACAEVPMQSDCPIPGGEPRLVPELVLVNYPSRGTCAGLPTPPPCACGAAYSCACVSIPSNAPCGITKCVEADLSQGLPLTLDCQ
jgi:hypothetical protein